MTLMLGITGLTRPGVDLRLQRQVREDLKLGGSLAGGWKFGGAQWIQGLIATRAFGFWSHPDTDFAGIPFGLGLGAATNGLVYFTADTGGVLNTRGDFGVYGGSIFAVSIPLRKGGGLVYTETLRSYAQTTFWWGPIVGAHAQYAGWISSAEAAMIVPSRGFIGVGMLSIAQSRSE